MKINTILEGFGQSVAFNDLQPLHIFVLKKMASNQLNLNKVSDKTLDAVDELVSFGLLDQNERLTQRGVKFADYANRAGSLQKRTLASKNAKGSVNRGEAGPRERNGMVRQQGRDRGFES